MSKKLAIIDDYEHAALESADWEPLQHDVEITVFHDHVHDEDHVVERLRDFDIVFMMRERTTFLRSTLQQLPRLELLITSGMRNLSIDLDTATEQGIVVTGTAILPYPAAEHTWALILALAKRIPAADSATRQGRWGDALNIGLNGKTLGVIGLGKLGSQVAKVGRSFAMNVIAWSHNLTAERCDEIGVGYVSKQDLLRTADFITIHLALGDRNRGLIGAEDFALMKPSSYFINTSRGPIVEEAALIDALEQNRIAGAGLDVFDVEPLAADHAFRRLENTVITPHQGYVTQENYKIFYATAIQNIRAWLDGEPINILN